MGDIGPENNSGTFLLGFKWAT